MSRSPSKSKSDSTFLSSPSGSSVACLTVWLVSLSCFKSLPGSSHLSARITNLDMKTEKYTWQSIHTEKTHIQYKFNRWFAFWHVLNFNFQMTILTFHFAQVFISAASINYQVQKCHKQVSIACTYYNYIKNTDLVIVMLWTTDSVHSSKNKAQWTVNCHWRLAVWLKSLQTLA